jgi:hypothetical protein
MLPSGEASDVPCSGLPNRGAHAVGAPPGRLRLLDLLLRRPAAGAARPEGRRLGADLAAGRRLLGGRRHLEHPFHRHARLRSRHRRRLRDGHDGFVADRGRRGGPGRLHAPARRAPGHAVGRGFGRPDPGRRHRLHALPRHRRRGPARTVRLGPGPGAGRDGDRLRPLRRRPGGACPRRRRADPDGRGHHPDGGHRGAALPGHGGGTGEAEIRPWTCRISASPAAPWRAASP